MLGEKKERDKNWKKAEKWSLINKQREIKKKKGAARSQRLIEKLSVEYALAYRAVKKNVRQDWRMHYEHLGGRTSCN